MRPFLHVFLRLPAGIKKPKNHRFRTTRGVDPKFLRNKRFAMAQTVIAVKVLRGELPKTALKKYAEE